MKKQLLKIRYNGTIRYLRPDEIVYVAVKNHKLAYFLKNGDRYEERRSLRSLEQDLPDTFYRIHSNCLVNVSKIKDVRTDECIVSFSDGSGRKVAEKRLEGLLQAYRWVMKKSLRQISR